MSDPRDVRRVQEKIFLQVVRGQRPWNELNDFGWFIYRTPEAWVFQEEPLDPPVILSVQDILQGAENLARDPVMLQQWAMFLMGSGDYELDENTPEPDHDLLYDALWDFAFGDIPAGMERLGKLGNR